MKRNNSMIHDELSVNVIDVIKVSRLRGDGTKEYPIRKMDSYYRLDGTLIAEIDPLREEVEVTE